jgi:pseudaminic acid synthase
MSRMVEIAGRRIGPGEPPYVIAELSANHNGDIERAFEIMAMAAEAGADAVKLQTYTADTMTIDCDRDDFRIKGGLWDGYLLHDLYKEAQTPWEWHEALFAKGRELGLTVFSTPFDDTAVDLLERLDAPAYKIASFEATDIPLLRRVAATGKPVIVSTGMASLGEISDLVETVRNAGCEQLILLHCVSSYPAPVEDTNLRTLPNLAETFGVVAGLSDHTMGTAVSIASVALGAAVIEKHVTLRRADGGPDSAFSLEPEELAELTKGCHTAWQSLGRVHYQREASERANVTFRRSLYAVEDIPEGGELTSQNVRIIRPGFGLAPRHLDEVIGRRTTRSIARGTPLGWNMIESDEETHGA